jgi:ferredoxin
MTYTLEIDEDACSAHGDCPDLAPEVFEVDDVARVIGTAPDELVLATAQACPPPRSGSSISRPASRSTPRRS